MIGAMEGYRGECGVTVEEVGPIIAHDPGPIAALHLQFPLGTNFSINLISFGKGSLVGGSYVF